MLSICADVALVELHVRVELCPELMVVGEALKIADTGAGAGAGAGAGVPPELGAGVVPAVVPEAAVVGWVAGSEAAPPQLTSPAASSVQIAIKQGPWAFITSPKQAVMQRFRLRVDGQQ